MGLALGGAVFGVALLGERFLAHFEMVAFFWWGAVYAFVRNQQDPPTRPWVTASSVLLALWVFWGAGPRGMERTALLFFAMGLVYLAQEWSGGARLTSRWGDLSYGMYIFAFPVQQALVLAGKSYSWSFEVYLAMSFGLTLVLSWLSWHFVEKRALRLKAANGCRAMSRVEIVVLNWNGWCDTLACVCVAATTTTIPILG
jgi:peptidoglycan/LPS O-acetylase OafA/YrhL